MKTEKEFNQWIRRMFYECLDSKAVIQRIETTTSNGVPDLLVCLPTKIMLIESKFETRKIRPEQGAFQIKTNSVIKGSINRCITLAAYPKTERFVMMEFDPSCITDNGVECQQEITFTLDKAGFADFINYTTK